MRRFGLHHPGSRIGGITCGLGMLLVVLAVLLLLNSAGKGQARNHVAACTVRMSVLLECKISFLTCGCCHQEQPSR